MRGAAALAVALVAAPLLAHDSPASDSLSDCTGLSLEVLQRTGFAGEFASAAHTAAVEVVDDATPCAIQALGLPDAAGEQEFWVNVLRAGESVAVYRYGALPGTSIVWSADIDLPPAPLRFVQGDTAGSISLRVNSGLPPAILTATVTIDVWNAVTRALVVDDGAGSISDTELLTDGGYAATFSYPWASGDLDIPGAYTARWRVCFDPASCFQIPARGQNLIVEIAP